MSDINYKVVLDNNAETIVTYDILSKIPKINKMINVINNDVQNVNKYTIHLHNININVFSSVIAILKYTLSNSNTQKSDFVITILKNMGIDELLDFIIVATDLELHAVKELATRYLKSSIQDNNVDGIRELFKIDSGFSVEDESFVSGSNEWILHTHK